MWGVDLQMQTSVCFDDRTEHDGRLLLAGRRWCGGRHRKRMAVGPDVACDGLHQHAQIVELQPAVPVRKRCHVECQAILRFGCFQREHEADASLQIGHVHGAFFGGVAQTPDARCLDHQQGIGADSIVPESHRCHAVAEIAERGVKRDRQPGRIVRRDGQRVGRDGQRGVRGRKDAGVECAFAAGVAQVGGGRLTASGHGGRQPQRIRKKDGLRRTRTYREMQAPWVERQHHGSCLRGGRGGLQSVQCQDQTGRVWHVAGHQPELQQFRITSGR